MLDVAADNLANLQTPGFQQSQVVLTSRPSTGTPGLQVGTGVELAAVSRDTSQASLLTAHGSTNLAIDGEGYFVLQGPQGQRWYTRDGTFRVDADGQLESSSGHRLLGWQSDRNIFQDELVPLFILDREDRSGASVQGDWDGVRRLAIGADGVLRGLASDGTVRVVGQVRLAQFSNPQGLASVGHNALAATSSSGAARIGNPGSSGFGRLLNHSVEASNTDVTRNIIQMSRAELLFRANLKVLSVADSLWQELFELGRR